jgi:hypothetical protein
VQCIALEGNTLQGQINILFFTQVVVKKAASTNRQRIKPYQLSLGGAGGHRRQPLVARFGFTSTLRNIMKIFLPDLWFCCPSVSQ